MGKFVKKAGLGYKEVPNGFYSPETQYYLATKKEYDSFMLEFTTAKEHAAYAENQVKAIKQEKEYKIQELKADLEHEQEQKDAALKEIETLKSKLALLRRSVKETEEKLHVEEDLNANLKRIARERANQQRGITPKKAHDGYIVLNSRQWEERYKHTLTDDEYDAMDYSWRRNHNKPYTEVRTAKVWKTLLQSPYDASIPLNRIQKTIIDDLDQSIMSDIGYDSRCKEEYNGSYDVYLNDSDNGMYKWQFIANYKSGFWEIEIYTTRGLKVPECRRPIVVKK